MEQTKLKESEVVDNCDAIVFGSYEDKGILNTIITYLKTDNDVVPSEIGHKFNVVLWQWVKPKEEEVELFGAVLGDPRGYVERIGKMGYSGLVIKENACRSDDIVAVLTGVLNRWGFEDKLIKKVIKQTVV